LQDKSLHESADMIYGRLLESVHITGYTMERACIGLEWLLEDNRWQKVGDGFSDINDFALSIDLSQFKIAVDRRKKLSRRFEELQATQRATAHALGVNHATIARDLGANAPRPTIQHKQLEAISGASAPIIRPNPLVVSGSEVARESEKKVVTAATRERGERERSEQLHQKTKTVKGLHRGDFRKLSPQLIPDESVHLILTDPPYDAGSVRLFDDAAREAARILRPGGSMLVYSGQKYLFEVGEELQRHLRYWWTICLQHSGDANLLRKLGVRANWKPIIWMVKGTRGDVSRILGDVIIGGGREKDAHEWQQAEEEAALLIESFTEAGETVVDFFAGSCTTGKAAEKLGRKWVGFEIDETTVAEAQRRLAG